MSWSTQSRSDERDPLLLLSLKRLGRNFPIISSNGTKSTTSQSKSKQIILVERRQQNPTSRIIRKSDEPSVVLVSLIFGENAANKKTLQMFVKSAETSGVDVILFGDPVPSFPLPAANVRHVPCSWKVFVDRVSQRLFDGKEPGTLRKATYYKIIDFKPLFAFLFPEHVQSYDWWGHVDNDLILGNVRQFLTSDMLSQYDIVSPISHRNVFGPFTVYRNSKIVNEVFRWTKLPLSTIFGTTKTTNFDEWGKMNSHKNLKLNHNSTMDGILDEHAPRLGIRIKQSSGIISWDGVCTTEKNRCEECVFRRGELTTKRGKERLLCHYQIGKTYLEESLQNTTTMNQMLAIGEFRVSYPEGFSPVTKRRQE
ncbi:hypothetical protein IV203_004534 [Nitzschia inconspicua]|uniref:Uncharacterized protein n=1 Tax=Nitzschia inconspicua TaxID=303405 RepID=A0A9K3L3S2_9STRA|nr:hypothetical protein IV203_004534 [Nitzschia inconspicua]